MNSPVLRLAFAALIQLAADAALANGVNAPGTTVDRTSGRLADPDWIPCTRDPNRKNLKHCSEEYRLCRESGKDTVACLKLEYRTLTPALKPSKDEYFACRSAGHSDTTCASILGEPMTPQRDRKR